MATAAMLDFYYYLGIYITLFCISLVFLLTRCYVRVKINKAFHAEDWFAVVALVIMSIETVLSALFTKSYFRVTPISQALIRFPGLKGFYPFLKHMLEIQMGSYLAFIISLWCIKFSFLLFYRRLSAGLSLSKFWVFAVTFCTLALAGNIVGFFFSCIPLSTYWNATCNFTQAWRNNATLWAFTATDILSDILIMIIPLRLLHHLRVSKNQKIGLCFLFCLGLAVIAMSIARTLRVEAQGSAKSLDPNWVAVWSMAEQTTAMIVCCLPAIRKLFQTEAEKHGNALSPIAWRSFSAPKFPKLSLTTKSSSSSSRNEKRRFGRDSFGICENHVLRGVVPVSPGHLEAGFGADYYPAKSPELPPPVRTRGNSETGQRAVVESRVIGSTGSQEDLNSTISSTDGGYRHELSTFRTRSQSYDTSSTFDKRLTI